MLFLNTRVNNMSSSHYSSFRYTKSSPNIYNLHILTLRIRTAKQNNQNSNYQNRINMPTRLKMIRKRISLLIISTPSQCLFRWLFWSCVRNYMVFILILFFLTVYLRLLFIFASQKIDLLSSQIIITIYLAIPLEWRISLIKIHFFLREKQILLEIFVGSCISFLSHFKKLMVYIER